MKGIDKRTHKDGTVSYRARVRIKGHPVLIQSFSSKTLAMKWKTDRSLYRKNFAHPNQRMLATFASIFSGGNKN